MFIVKMSAPPKVLYRFSATPIKNLRAFWQKWKSQSSNLYGIVMGSKQPNQSRKRTKTAPTSQFQCFLYNYSNQNSVELA